MLLDMYRSPVSVYRQVPFILLAQAFFYFCPSLVWHGLNQKGGMDADSILNSSAKLIHYTHEDARKEIIDSVVMQLDRCVRTKCTCTLKTHQLVYVFLTQRNTAVKEGLHHTKLGSK